MAKVLEGYSKVVKVENEAGFPCYFALYDDGVDYQPGDMVVSSGWEEPVKIKQIIPAEEITQKIVYEVICKIDITAYTSYKQRLEQRKRKEELRKELCKRKREIQGKPDDDYYASKDEKYAKLLKEYREILQ